MFENILNRRGVLFAALFAFAIGLALMSGATSTLPVAHAQGQIIQGSQLRVSVLDWQDKHPWTGSTQGPSGSIAWDAPMPLGSDMSTVQFLTGLEAGTYTIDTSTPIAPGWHIAGYLVYPNAGTGGCNLSGATFAQTASVTFSDSHPVWGICIAVERDGAIFGSSLNVTFVTDDPAGAWLGGVKGPNSIYYGFNDMLYGNSGVIHNLVPGTWDVHPANPPKDGYTVAGYYKFESSAASPHCSSNPSAYKIGDHSLAISQAHANWVVCVRIVPAVAGSELWITMVTDGWPVVWDGTLTGPNNYSASFETIQLGAAAHSTSVLNLAPGTWSATVANHPAPGYTLKGYALLDGGGFNTCPVDAASYGLAHSVQINDQHPVKHICILVDHPPVVPNSSLTLGIKAIPADGDNSWQGKVTGPAGYAVPWNQLQIGGPNFMGGQHDVFAGTYSVVAGKPVRPGWVVKGYASYETTQFLQMCPLDEAAYKHSPTPVTFSDQHPNWGICILVEPAPVVPAPTPFVAHLPEDVPTYDLPAGSIPAVTVVPTATTTPVSATPTATATKPIQTQVPVDPGQTAKQPGANEAGGIPPAARDTPLPPNTGNGTAGAGRYPLALALGAMLMAASALIVTATRLPGRRKR